ncbi:hypothetical protein Tco_0745256 [Tanacetum coccineum]
MYQGNSSSNEGFSCICVTRSWRESKSRAFGTDITNYTGSKRYRNDSSSDWSSKASTTQRNLYLARSRLPLPYLQMGQLQYELRVARSLLAEKETEIQGVRITQNQVMKENERMRAILGELSTNVTKGSKCRTFYWVDPELPSDYYKQEVYKLIQKDKQLKEENYILNGKIRELQKEFDFEKSTLEKQVLMLQMELKESKSCLVFYRKVVVVMTDQCKSSLLFCCCNENIVVYLHTIYIV